MYEELYKCWGKYKSLHPSRSPRLTGTKQIVSSETTSLRSITTFIKQKQSKNRDEIQSPTSPRSIPRSRSVNLESVSAPETSDSQWNLTKYVSKRAQIFLKNPKKYISSFEEDLSEETRQHFREHFAFSENEKLHAGNIL